jgi:DNA-binding beta-propeller fold protein YncE
MKPTPFSTLLTYGLVVLVSLVSLAGCGTTAPVKDAQQETAAKLPSWPNPPAPTRIRTLRSVTGAQDWGIEKSLFRRVIDAILGSGNEHFVRPSAVAEFQRVLYVADPGAQALWILDAERNELHKVQRIGDEALLSPVAVAVRPDGAVYLADSRLKTVFLLDRDGKLINIAAREGLERPAGLAYDAARQRLYVADSAGQKIVVFAPDATVIRSWGHAGSRDGEFNYPTHLALGPTGTLLVTDALNFRVQAFDADGRFLWKFGHHGDGSGDVATPKGVAFDRDGHVFLVSALFDAVQIFDQRGRFLLGFGEHGAELGQFWLPGGIFINPQNEIYVADAYNRRIQVFMVVPDSDVKENQ